jgi:RNA polymerase sigma-70 factor (ECF subfamily)
MQSTDESLINAHCQGDPTAFRELMRRYGSSVLKYLTRMSGSREQADDLFQETFKRVHEKAHTFRGSRFRPWLFTIATHVAIDGLRKRRRLRVVSMNEKSDCCQKSGGGLDAVAVADNSFNPSQAAERAERAEQVRQTIELLPAKQRATLVLAYYQQLSYREVAEVLGCSVGTVKIQMYRALRTLAKNLPDVWGGTR